MPYHFRTRLRWELAIQSLVREPSIIRNSERESLRRGMCAAARGVWYLLSRLRPKLDPLAETHDGDGEPLSSPFPAQNKYSSFEIYDLASSFPHNAIESQTLAYSPILPFLDLASRPPMISALTSDDNEVLSYFRITFSQLKSTRNHAWSAHAVFLYQASRKQTALHFLLAVSHNEFAIHCGVPSNGSNIVHEAREHYERGSQLLLQNMTGRTSPDHVGDLISFLYMYMFWMRRNTVYPQRLRQISKGVLTYVTTHDVLSLCARAAFESLSSNLSGDTADERTQNDCALLARILIYLYDRDVYCSFFGCGGHFVDYLDFDTGRRRNLFTISRTSLHRYWGNDYPRD